MNLTENILLVWALLLFVSVAAGKLAYKFGAPALLLFLGVGMVFGWHFISFNSFELTQFIGMLALCIILFSGGMDTKFSVIRPVLAPGITLATVGVAMTALLIGGFIFLFSKWVGLALSFPVALLLAATMSSTDSASVFSILRSKKQGLGQNLRPLLELESGSNDPMAYMLTIVLLQLLSSPNVSIGEVIWLFVEQFALGMVCGYLLGRLSKRIINRIDLTNDALYSVLLISVMLFIFGFTTWIGGNGYLAVYIGGLFLGNSRFVHKRSSMKFFDGLTWLFQIIMFLSLGLLVNPSELLPVASIGVLVGLFMIFISRPLSVMFTMLPFRKFSLNGRLFTSFVGLRGAVPIIFATYPMIAGVEKADTIFNIVFFITILSLIFQGTMIPQVARWLKLDLPMAEKKKLKEFDVEFSDEIKSAMSEMVVTAKMIENGDRLMDITIPDHTLVAMVKRDHKYFIPRGNTHLIIGDVVLIITDNEKALDEVRRMVE
jgi:cell volume regulation protein A